MSIFGEKVLQTGEFVMYTGTNPSALRSQQWIAEGLLELMREKQFAQITVKEICSRADLTRQTFYQFFSSKEDVVRFALTKYYTAFEEGLLGRGVISLEVLSAAFFHFFQEHKHVVLLLIEHRLDYLLSEQFSLALPRIMNLCVEEGSEMIANPHINSFVVGGLSAMIIDWLKSDSKTDETELTRLFLQLFKR